MTGIMRILIDCTDTYFSGLNTGIQRVVRNLVEHGPIMAASMDLECQAVIIQDQAVQLIEGLEDPRFRRGGGILRRRISDLYLATARRMAVRTGHPGVRRFLLAHRREFGLAWLLFTPVRLWRALRRSQLLDPSPVLARQKLESGDILFLPDASWDGESFHLLAGLRDDGVRLAFLIHDIIPLTHPQFFQQQHVVRFRTWLQRVVQLSDLLVFNSRCTMESVTSYLREVGVSRLPPGAVLRLGYDLGPEPEGEIGHRRLRRVLLSPEPAYLCVGTLEPRKNHAQAIDAFELLWRQGSGSILVLIGRSGWLCEELLQRIRRHPERGRRLHWFSDVMDRDLDLAYLQARALIFPSRVEGFGLPLVEAMGRGLPVLASDICAFREVAGGQALFFPLDDHQALAGRILELETGRWQQPMQPLVWPNWRECSANLLSLLQQVLPAQEHEA